MSERFVQLSYCCEGADAEPMHDEAVAWFSEVADKLGLARGQVDIRVAPVSPGVVELAARATLHP